ncbi:hypothetical protein A0H81_12365 [Grifola frondosa]|uniref:Uncharacterized protein n=1 Tax=Grifola frondosa TaxID=5627 RepID=A0A1C7LSN6_GRIFR|nr:hypothetical protein A0H81_12365 [Grifola frondosa]
MFWANVNTLQTPDQAASLQWTQLINDELEAGPPYTRNTLGAILIIPSEYRIRASRARNVLICCASPIARLNRNHIMLTLGWGFPTDPDPEHSVLRNVADARPLYIVIDSSIWSLTT